MTKAGYTYDREKIKKSELDAFMNRARQHWSKPI